jgi:hypothetical protein
MKKSQILFAISAVILSTGCAMKTKILDAGAVSMTHNALKPGQKLEEKGQVSGEFCGDSSRDKGTIGLMDEAIKAAQKSHSVDFISNATFYVTGANCMSVEGTGMKIVGSATTAEETKGTEPGVVPASTGNKNIKKMKQ